MILEPRKSAEDIDRRLNALTDAELAELLASLNREFHDNEPESYSSPSAPYWKKRIALVALAGLMALTAGFSAAVSTVRDRPAAPPKRIPPVALRHHHASSLPVRRKIAMQVPAHRAAAPLHAAIAVAPSEALVRRARAALLHEQVLAAQAQAEARAQAAQAHRQAQLAMQARAQANAQALNEALAKARAQARAEAIAQARAQALAN